MPEAPHPIDTEALLAARYGTREAVVPGPASGLIDTILAHRSVRAFLPEALAEGTLERLVAAAQSAATSSNLQTWSVVAVEDPERKARLSVLANDQAFIREAPLFLVFLADLSRNARLGQAQGAAIEGLAYTETFLVAVVDAALASQNAAIAAESMGLGICYVGAMRNRPEEVAAELGLPPGSFAVFGMAVGRPDPARPASIKPRLPQELVLHRETYRSENEPERIAAYDERLTAFSEANGMGRTDWSSRIVSRLSIRGLGGRDRIRGALERLGFPLR